MWLPFRVKKRKAANFKRKEVEYLDSTFTVVELSQGEIDELAALSVKAQKEGISGSILNDWLVCHGCEEYLTCSAGEVSNKVGRSCLDFLANEVLKISDLHEGAQEELEKKSEASPAQNSSVS